MSLHGKSIVVGKTRNGYPALLTPKQRQTHMQVVGASGRGKSKFLERMIRQDIINGAGLCLIDPHGTLYNEVVRWCAGQQISEYRNIRLCNPNEEGWRIGFNPLHFDGVGEPTVRIDAMVKACAQVWGGEDTNATPLLKKCLRAVFYALMMNKLTLLEAPYLTSATDPRNLRRFLTRQLTDEVFATLWQDFNALTPREYGEQFGSTNNRLIEFLSAPQVRTIIGQQDNILDARRCMDEGDIVLFNLQSGANLSFDNTRLLGTLIINEFFLKALNRPKGSRPFYLYIDECYQYLNEDVENILDQARKFGLHLVLSHQRLGQLRKASESVYNAVMTGAQTKVVFGGLEASDARALAENIFLGEFDLQKPKHRYDKPSVVDHTLEWLESESETAGENETSSTRISDGESVTLNSDGEEIGTGTHTGGDSSDTFGRSWGRTSGRAQTYRPVLRELPTTAHSLEELYLLAVTKLVNLPKATAIMKVTGLRSCRITVPEVKEPIASSQRCARFRERVLAARAFVSPLELVEKEIFDRQERIKQAAKERVRPPEPDDPIEEHGEIADTTPVAIAGIKAKPAPDAHKKREWR